MGTIRTLPEAIRSAAFCITSSLARVLGAASGIQMGAP